MANIENDLFSPLVNSVTKKEITLEKMRMAIRNVVDPEIVNNHKFSFGMEDYMKTMAIKLERDIACYQREPQTIEAKVTVAVPNTWWQYLKWEHSELFPDWFLEKYPIKFHEETKTERKTYTVKECYPNIALPEYKDKCFFIVEEIK